MAVVLVLLGGVMGFACGTVAMIFTDRGLLAAFGFWVSVELVATLLALVVVLLARVNYRPTARDLHA